MKAFKVVESGDFVGFVIADTPIQAYDHWVEETDRADYEPEFFEITKEEYESIPLSYEGDTVDDDECCEIIPIDMDYEKDVVNSLSVEVVLFDGK